MSTTPSKKIALSGIKPTGLPHLGNYLGMIKPIIEMQDTHQVVCFIADYHALTTVHNAESLSNDTKAMAASLIACGLDPTKTVLFRQSDVPEVLELSHILSCVTHLGLLKRNHAYKAYVNEHKEDNSLNLGTFSYPVLMAADILLYKADVVPVGLDQLQHIEITQDISRYFNSTFGNGWKVLNSPEPLITKFGNLEVVPGIDGNKMSKSRNNTIPLFCSEKELRKKVMKIVTDGTPMNEPKTTYRCNVFQLYSLFASKEELRQMDNNYERTDYGYGHAKEDLVKLLMTTLGPFQKEYEQLTTTKIGKDYLELVLRHGAMKARGLAVDTLKDIKRVVGLPLQL